MMAVAALERDAELMLRVRDGDPASFALLLERHRGPVIHFVYRMVQNQAVAEELAQEVFLDLYNHLGDLQSPAHVEFWLRKVASRRCIDYVRRLRRHPNVGLEDAPEISTVPQQRDPFLTEALRKLIASLPEKSRMVVLLRYQEDLAPAEIAETLDIPLNSVKSCLHRALAMLREKLERTQVRP